MNIPRRMFTLQQLIAVNPNTPQDEVKKWLEDNLTADTSDRMTEGFQYKLLIQCGGFNYDDGRPLREAIYRRTRPKADRKSDLRFAGFVKAL